MTDGSPAPALRTAASAASSTVLVEHLEVGFRDKLVWQDASFTVEPGEFVAVIGPNGAGKTTLFRVLLGLMAPTHGRVEVFGVPPKRGSPQIGYVPQRHTITNETNIACFELVRLACFGNRWGFSLSSRQEREAAQLALESVGAGHLGEKPLGALSGGEAQRVFLAEALVSNPQLLLLDEPLSHLDLRRAKELVTLVNGIVRSRNVAALLVAHDINPLIQHLDKVVYIANRKIAAGAPKDVLTSDSLSALYGVPVEVLRDSRGNIVIVGGEDPHEGEDH